MSLSMTCKAVAILAFGGIAAAAPAFADQVETRTQMVSIAGLDLHSDAGRAVLRHRIAVAARGVCGEATSLGKLGDSTYARCVTDAERQATARAETLVAGVTGTMSYAAK